MFLRLAIAGLYILGLVWCYHVIGRFREDLQEIREVKEITRTGAIIFIWIVTVIIAIVLIRYSFVIIENLVSFIRMFL